jgi:hypothetical protein
MLSEQWQPDGPNAFVRWMQRRAYRKYGPPKMTWMEAEMERERLDAEAFSEPKFWLGIGALALILIGSHAVGLAYGIMWLPLVPVAAVALFAVALCAWLIVVP